MKKNITIIIVAIVAIVAFGNIAFAGAYDNLTPDEAYAKAGLSPDEVLNTSVYVSGKYIYVPGWGFRIHKSDVTELQMALKGEVLNLHIQRNIYRNGKAEMLVINLRGNESLPTAQMVKKMLVEMSGKEIFIIDGDADDTVDRIRDVLINGETIFGY